MILIGFVAMTAGFVAVPRRPTSSWEYGAFVIPILLVAAGMALSNGPCSSIATSSVPEEQVGSASGISNMARYVGAAVMTAIVAAVYSHDDRRRDRRRRRRPTRRWPTRSPGRRSCSPSSAPAASPSPLLAGRHRPPEPLAVDRGRRRGVDVAHPSRPPPGRSRARARGSAMTAGAAHGRCRHRLDPGGYRASGSTTWPSSSGRGERDLDEVLADIDLIVTGPHASAAFPAELQPVRRRPVHEAAPVRLHRRVDEPGGAPVGARSIRTCCTSRTRTRGPCATPTGPPVDLVAGSARPSSGWMRRERTAGLAGRRRCRSSRDLRIPAGATASRRRTTEWNELSEALTTAGALGIDRYERVRDDLIERVIEAKLRRLATLDPATVHGGGVELGDDARPSCRSTTR